MKFCPKCGKENNDDAMFCEHCGYKFAAEPIPARSQRKASVQPSATEPVQSGGSGNVKPKDSKFGLIIGVLAGLALATGVGVALAGRGNQEQATPASTTATTSSENVNHTKYDKIIAEAKALTINGDYKKSNIKLAAIPASDLGKTEFSAVKEQVDKLTEQNEEGLEEEQAASKEKEAKQEAEKRDQQQAAPAPSGNSGFVGDFAKWANNYTFYYNQSSQKQQSLKISANGGVTQNNSDGTQYFGKASITGSGGDVLSYVTNRQYPSSMPDTKMINPNVKITVNWDSGGSQVFYGYLSYSSRLALTDGVAKGSGVNEVWISY